MKKLTAILFAAMLALTACSNGGDQGKDESASSKFKIGTGIVTTEKGTDAGEKDGSYQVDTYYATIVLKDDKIVSTKIDVAQNKQPFTTDGTLGEFAGKGTKKEQGDDYGMAKYSDPKAVAEWYVQMGSFEEWTVGKTVAEVLDIKTTQKDESHPAVPAEADLTSKVTISVENYLAAIKKASENLVEVEGLAKFATASTTSASADAIEINTTVASVGVDADGKIVYAFADAMQSKATVEAGKITVSGILETKGERKADYGMNWFEQRDAYVEWLAGKTKADVDGGSDIPSSVSISTNDFKAALDKAFGALVEVK